MEYHGMSKSPEYKIWSGMKARCLNRFTTAYHRYGGRGIQICDRWLNSFENFYADMGPRPSQTHSIDRINNDGHYEPNNCRWATVEEQVFNRSTNIDIIDPETGESITTKEAMEKYNLKKGTLFTRLDRGTDISKPIQEYNKLHEYKGKQYTSTQLAEIANIPAALMRSRIAQGFTIEEAVELPPQYDPTYPYKNTQFTVRQFSDYTNIEDYNIRHHLRQGKTLEQIEQHALEYNRTYPYLGKEYTATQLANMFGVAYSTIRTRLKNGESPEQIERNVEQSKAIKEYELDGKMYTMKQLCDMTGFTSKGFRRHFARGVDAKTAIALITKNSQEVFYAVDGKQMKLFEIAKQENCAHESLKKHLSKGRTMQQAVEAIRANKARNAWQIKM